MANRGKSRGHGRGRGRSRKRRPAPGAPGAAVVDAAREGDRGESDRDQKNAGRGETDQTTVVNARAPVNARPPRARTRTRGNADFRDPLSVGERPPAPWHPWPLSEMLILIGAVGTVVGLARLGHGGISNGGPVLFAGLGAVVLGTIEITWREHHAGYRSHTLILALLPVVVFHSAVVLGLAAVTTVPRLLNVGLLAIDMAIFAVLFKLLRARHLDARARVVSRR